MARQDINNICPVETTLDLIGGKYKSLILWHLLDRVLRFSELQRQIPQASPKMLTQQLRELEDANLIKRKIYPVVPPKVEYSITERGISIRPILRSMYDWGSDYLHGEGKHVCCSMKYESDSADGPARCAECAKAASR